MITFVLGVDLGLVIAAAVIAFINRTTSREKKMTVPNEAFRGRRSTRVTVNAHDRAKSEGDTALLKMMGRLPVKPDDDQSEESTTPPAA